MADWVVRVSGGTGAGTSWAGAWNGFGAIVWGSVGTSDTIWVAGGSYSSALSVGKSGASNTSRITIKRIVAGDVIGGVPTSSMPGFVDTPATMPPGISCDSFSNITVDGRTHDGIRVNIGTSGGIGLSAGAQTSVSNISFFNVSAVGPYATVSNEADGFNLAWNNPSNGSNNVMTNILFNNCSVRGVELAFKAQAWVNCIIEYCYIADTKNLSQTHDDLMYSYPINGLIWRYNVIANSEADGIFIGDYGGAVNWFFYGNLYYNNQGAWYIVTKGAAALISTTNGPMYLYNNTFFNTSSGGQVQWNGTHLSAQCYVYNNVFWNVVNNMTPSFATMQDSNGTTIPAYTGTTPISDYNAYNGSIPSGETHSVLLSSSPFTTTPANTQPVMSVVQPWGSGGNFHPTTSGQTALAHGLAVLPNADSFIDSDLDGNSRGNSGSWLIGAYDVSGTPAPAPSVPTGLTIGTITSTTITLSWTTSTDAPNSNASLTYNLQRKTGAGSFSTIKTGIAGVTSGTITYTDSSLTASTLYTYNVQAQNPGGLTSAFTTTNATGTTTAAAPAPSVPTGLTAVALTSSSISLSWTTSTDAPDTNASLTYKLQRKLGAGAFATLPAVVPGVASGTVSFTDTGLAPSSLYTYNVQCVNQEGLSSAFTTTNASATTSAGPAVAFVQITDSGAPTGTATTKTATYALAQGATHTNIVVVNIGNASSATLGLTISSVADTVNGAYTAAPPGLVAMSVGTLSQGSQVFYRSNIASAAAGGNTVTVTASAAASFFEIAVLEYSGLATTSPVDVSVSAAVNGTGATVNATSGNSVPTLNANDLLLGAFSFFDAPSAAGTGYTARNTPPPYTLYVEDQLVTATGSYASTATAIAGGSGWTAQLIAFKAAPAGAPTTLTDSVALIPGTKLAPVSRDTHRGKPSLLPGSVISVLSRDTHRESVVVFPGSLLKLMPSTGGTITLPDVASISAGTALSFNARRTYRSLTGFNPGIAPLLNPTLNGIIAPQVVQVNSATPSSVSTISCTYVQAQNRGDLNIVIVGWTNASSLTVNSVTDTVNGVYTLGVPLVTIGTVQQAMYFLPNILSASAGTNIVTVVLSGVATQPDVRILEYSGIVTSLPIDATGSNTGSNASPSVSVVSLNSNDLVVSGGTSISNFLSAGPLFTTRLLTADHNIADDAVFVWGQWVNSSGQAAIHWEDAAWHWEDAHFWEQGSSGTGGTAGDWINTGSTQGKWFG